MIEKQSKPKIVGEFIKKRREALNISQKSLGLAFNPPVTTQFISNLERGVTPLPHSHVPVIAKALQTTEAEIAALLEREYALKLSTRLGTSVGSDHEMSAHSAGSSLVVDHEHLDFMRRLYSAYRSAEPSQKHSFVEMSKNILKMA
jgi:transcriptional regulator with XRE-family HTH domain